MAKLQTRTKQTTGTTNSKGTKLTTRYNPTKVYGWQSQYNTSYDLINDYYKRINAGEWLSLMDREEYKSAIDSYITSSNALRDVSKYYGTKYTDEEEKNWQDSLASINSNYNSIRNFYSQFEDREQYNDWNKYENWSSFQEANIDPDKFKYNDYVQKGSNTLSSKDSLSAEGIKDLSVNMVKYAEIFGKGNLGNAWNELKSTVGLGDELVRKSALINSKMTGPEKNRYYYYIGTGDWESANGYLEYLMPQLEARYNNEIYSGISEELPFLEPLINFGAGVTSGVQGILNIPRLIAGKEGIQNNIVQNTSQQLMADNTGIRKLGGEVLYSIGNMLPSIAVGNVIGGGASALGATATTAQKVGQIGGSVYMGLSSAGNNYADMIRQGYGVNEARLYGLLTGTAEGGLNYAIGGISSTGGRLSGHVVKNAVDGIDNGIARFVADVALNSGSEALEEGIQTALEPVFKSIATGEKYEPAKWSDITYSALMGAVTSGVLEGVPRTIGLSQGISSAKKTYGNVAGDITTEALAINPGSKVAQNAQNRINSGKAVTGAQIYSMLDNITRSNTKTDTGKISESVHSQKPSVKVQTNEGKSTEIGSIKSVEGDVATVELGDGTLAKVGLGKNVEGDIKFNDAKVEQVFKIATERIGKVDGWTVETANAMVTAFENNPNGLGVSDFTRAWSEAYNIGRNNNSKAQLDNSSYATLLDESARSNAYNIGKAIAIAPKTITSNATYSVTFEEGIDQSTLTKKQKNDIKALEIVSKALGVNVKVFDSPVNAKGERIGKNGSYNPTTRTIKVDLHAGNHGEGIMLFTAAHEVTHHMREVARDKFNNFADAVFEALGEDGKSAFNNKLEQLQKGGHLEGMSIEEAYDLAFEEVVADAAEKMLTDTDALVKLSETLKKKDKTLWQKFKDAVVNLLNKIKKAYAELNPQSEAAQALLNAQEKLEKIQKLWVEGVVAAAEVSDQVSTEKSETKNQDRDFEDYDKPITIEDVNILRSIGRKSINDFTLEEIKKAQKWAYKFYQELGVKSPFFRAWFGEWRAHQKSILIDIAKMENFDGKNPRGSYKNKDTGWNINSSSVGYDETIAHSGKDKQSIIAMKNIDKIIENAILFDTEVSEYGRGKKSIYTAFMHKFYAPINIDGKIVIAKMSVDESYSPGQTDTNKKFYHVRAIEIETASSLEIGKSHTSIMENTVSKYSISDLYELVKTFDKDFSPAPEVNKVMLNEDGTPRVFYHGTNENFTEFKPEEMSSVEGSYFFAENRMDAEAYGDNIYEVYLSARKLADYDNQPSEFYRLRNKRAQVAWLKERGYDGWYADMDSGGWGELSVFSPEQIKSATDNIGTFSKGEKNIKYSDRTYLEAVDQGDMTTAQKMVDEAAKKAGYTIKAYHGTNAQFDTFDNNKAKSNNGSNFYGNGFYFTTSRMDAANYGKIIKPVYLRAEKILDLDSDTWTYDLGIESKKEVVEVGKTKIERVPFPKGFINIHYTTKDAPNEWKSISNVSPMQLTEDKTGKTFVEHKLNPKTSILPRDVKNLAELAKSKGYDAIRGGGTNIGDLGTEYVVFLSSQIKSADPVTYDGDGNVIPLSERFKAENNDIRYQDRLSDEESFSNRSILANALDSTVQNEVEQKKLDEYRSRIAMLDAEEAKLANLKAEIKELTFGKKRDPARLREIKEEARKTEARIDLHDKKLLQLESTTALKNVLERARKDSYAKAMQKGKELMHKNVEGRYKTIERNKIKKIAHELDTLLNKGNKKRNVKIEAQGVVRAALDLSDMYFTSDDELVMNGIKTEATDKEVSAMEQYKALYEKLHATDDDVTNHKQERAEIRHEMNEIKKDFAELLERERKRINNTKASTVYDALIKEYEKLANSPSRHIAQAFDADTLQHIKTLRDSVGERLVSEMTLEQIKDVYKAFKMIKTMVTNSNKLFNENLKESVDALGNSTLYEIEKHGHKERFTKVGKAASEFSWNNLKPVYLMERTGSETLQKLFQNVLNGESVWATDMLEAREYIEKQKNEYKYDTWDFKKTHEFSTPSGKTFKLNLEQIMTIYAYSKRGEQAIEHLRTDGFVFDKVVVKKKGIEYELNDKTAYKITDETRIKMVGLLTQDQRAYVDAMQEYLSKTMGAKGNEVSKAMYGIELYGEENYLPIHSEGAYLERAREQAKGDVKLKNKGFTKSTVKHARNAIVLSDFDKLCTEHIAEMSSYHAFTLPLEDFYKVYNYQVDSDDMADKRGVIPALENAYGKGATGAIDQLLTDLNGGARGDSRETIAKNLIALYKKAKVMLSLSVVIQQPSSIIRAQAMIDPKYFIGQKIGDTKRKELWAEMKKYAPVTIIKEMGYFDVGMGQASADWLLDDPTLSEKIDEIASWPAAKADELTWIAIWNAVKRETASKNPAMNTNSKEFLEKAGARFEDVIRHTQVYDSTLARSGNMRSKSAFMQMATSFMAEPTTSLNMREMALRSKDRARIARTTAVIYATTLLNAILVAIPYAMRDDDEDETFGEKYISALSTSFVDNINPITSIPFAKDVWSLLQGYNVDRADMAAASELIDSFNGLMKIATKSKEEREQGDIENALLNFIGDLSSFSGLPIDHVRRDVMSAFNTYKTLTRGYDTTWKSIEDTLQRDFQKSTPVWNLFKTESKNEKLYEAILAKDNKYVERFKSTYEDEDAYNAALRKAIRENDPRVKEAAKARLEGDADTWYNLMYDVIEEGNFDKYIIKDAFDAEYNYQKRKKDELSGKK